MRITRYKFPIHIKCNQLHLPVNFNRKLVSSSLYLLSSQLDYLGWCEIMQMSERFEILSSHPRVSTFQQALRDCEYRSAVLGGRPVSEHNIGRHLKGNAWGIAFQLPAILANARGIGMLRAPLTCQYGKQFQRGETRGVSSKG